MSFVIGQNVKTTVNACMFQTTDEDPECAEVSLNLQRWACLVQTADIMMTAVGTNHDVHLGGHFYVQTFYNSDNVHITKYEKTDKGALAVCMDQNMVLTKQQFRTIVDNFGQIEDVIPELSLTTPCYLSEDHQNQMGYYTCPECCPDGLEEDW